MKSSEILKTVFGDTNRIWNNAPLFNKEYLWQLTAFDIHGIVAWAVLVWTIEATVTTLPAIIQFLI